MATLKVNLSARKTNQPKHTNFPLIRHPLRSYWIKRRMHIYAPPHFCRNFAASIFIKLLNQQLLLIIWELLYFSPTQLKSFQLSKGILYDLKAFTQWIFLFYTLLRRKKSTALFILLSLINNMQKDLSADLFSDQRVRGQTHTQVDVANIKSMIHKCRRKQVIWQNLWDQIHKTDLVYLKTRWKNPLNFKKAKPPVNFQRNKTFKTY